MTSTTWLISIYFIPLQSTLSPKYFLENSFLFLPPWHILIMTSLVSQGLLNLVESSMSLNETNNQIHVSLSAEIPGGIESHTLPFTRDGLSCLRHHISHKPSSSSWLISCYTHHEMEADESVNHSWDFRFTILGSKAEGPSLSSFLFRYKKYQKWTKGFGEPLVTLSDGCRHLISMSSGYFPPIELKLRRHIVQAKPHRWPHRFAEQKLAKA